MQRIALFILAVCVTLAAGAQEDVRLPDIGSSAETIITPEQERYIGEQMLRGLRDANAVVEDPLLNEFMSALGYRIVAHSDRPEQSFTFFLVRSEQINAFAAPGGFIGTNTGLIATAESESELAAVIAHEVAHITQRHLVRAVESMQKVSLPIMLAMIGVLIAAQGSNSDAAQAAVVGGSALLQQQQINFTRGNEYEADRVGIHALASAGYDPEAMSTFFWRMGRATRANAGEGLPEFLRTHPVTSTRISEAKDRAATITRQARDNPPPASATGGVIDLVGPPSAQPIVRAAVSDDFGRGAKAPGAMPAQADIRKSGRAHNADDFLRFRERARVLGTSNSADLIPFYTRTLAIPGVNADPYRYGLALAKTRAGRPREAIKLMEPMVAASPAIIGYALALAEAESAVGNASRALEQLAALSARFPGHRAVSIHYAQQLVASGSREAAGSAVELLRPLLSAGGEDTLLQLTFARACELAGDEVRAGEAHAEVALLNGRYDDALQQLNNLLRRTDVDYYQRARIEARIAQLTPIALEQRRRQLGGQS